MVLSVVAKILLFALTLLGVFPGFHSSTTLYFTNDHSIEKIQNNSATPVIQVAMAPRALDCNSCDQRIYWASQEERAIKRGFPSNNSQGSNIEVILDVDLVSPQGIAVDWRGDNVYFTDNRGDGVSRLDVITCDGKHRRILFNNLTGPGPITVDPVHGHIYWAEFTDIWIAEMDGSNSEILIPLPANSRVEDMAIDFDNNLLYWIEQESPTVSNPYSTSQIYHAFLNGTGKAPLDDHILNDTMPSGVSISHNTLYWTQKQTESVEGAIYSYSLLDGFSNGFPNLVFSDSNLNPHDISSFVSTSITEQVSGGCSENNGGCRPFCFTAPSVTDPFSSPSSEYRCGCPTGLTFQSGSTSICRAIPNDFLLFIQTLPESDIFSDVCPTEPISQSQISMLSLDVNDTFPMVLPIHINAESSDLAYDLTNSLVYWTEHNPPLIKRAKLDGSEVETVVSKDLLSPNMITLDSSYDTLFWTDSTLNRIEAMSLRDGIQSKKRRVLVTTGLQHPFGIALNEQTGVMYWTDQSTEPLVQKATLNGTVDNSFQVSNTVTKPGAIAVRLSTGEIYWAETQEGLRSIERGEFDGLPGSVPSYINLENAFYGGDIVGMDFLGDKLYFTERQSGRIVRADIDEVSKYHSPTPQVVLENVHHPRGIVAIHNEDEPINKGCEFGYGGCEDICVSGQGDNDDSRQCICRENHRLVDDTDCEQERYPLLLLSNDSSVVVLERETWQSSNVDLTERVLSIPAGRMDADYTDNILYWISTEDGWIYRTLLNSSNYSDPETEPVVTCCYTFSDIAVDWWGRNLYWIDSTNGVLGMVKLNGRSLQVIASDLNHPVNLIAHPEFRTLYFVENSTNNIESIHMDGNSLSVDVVFDSNEPISGLTLDAEKNLLFWSSNNCIYYYDLAERSGHYILICTTPATSTYFNTGPPTLLAYYNNDVFTLDREARSILFVDELDPKEPLTPSVLLFTLDSYGLYAEIPIRDMIFVDPSVQPGTHECVISNGECLDEDRAVCIVTGSHSHECRCSPTQYLDVHTNEYGQSRCHAADSFLVMSSPQQILYLPLRDPPYLVSDSECEEYQDPPIEPRELPLGPLDNVMAVAFDPVHDSVVWYDRTTSTINKASLNGTTRETLASVPSSSVPRSFTYDWRGGQFFIVDQLEFQIDMYTVNGVSGVVLNQNLYEGDMALYEPTVVAADSDTRELYFADKYHLTIKKVDLRTLEVSRLLPEGFRKLHILHMAVDELNDIIYWYDNVTMALEMYNIEEQNVSLIAHSAPHHISSLAATNVPVLNTGPTALPETGTTASMLYWFNQTDHSIYWYNQVTVDRLLVVDSKFKDITGLAAFDVNYEMMIPTSLPCAEPSRPCTHVCVPEQANAAPPTCLCTQYLQQEDNGTCSASSCSELSVPCNSSDTCIPAAYFCDGVDHCPGGSDESNCPCASDEFHCYLSGGCVNRSRVCNDKPDCIHGEDEKDCCETVRCPLTFIGSVSCVYDPFICDGFNDCNDGQDEKGCSTAGPEPSSSPTNESSPQPSPSPSSAPTPSSLELAYIVWSALPLFFVIVALLVCLSILYYRRNRKKASAPIHHFTENFSIQSSTSPQPSHMRSDATSEYSIKTMETGSTHVGGLTGTNGINTKRHSAYSTDPSNPPNSPINTPHSVACLSLASSRNFSEYEPGVPPVPNPSVNYDAYSDRFSSVSQVRIQATIPPHSSNAAAAPFRRNNGLSSYPVPSYASNYYSTSYAPGRYFQQHPAEHDQLDNISESTVSLSTFHPELNVDTTSYTATSFCEQSGETYPYDEAPPPSPVTEYYTDAIGHGQ